MDDRKVQKKLEGKKFDKVAINVKRPTPNRLFKKSKESTENSEPTTTAHKQGKLFG